MATGQNSVLTENYYNVLNEIDKACMQAQRERDSVTLLAVSKFHNSTALATIAQCGQRDFAESYLQEAKNKRLELKDLLEPNIYNTLQWHSIGHIQTNKAKEAAGQYELLHTVDSERLCHALDKALARNLLDTVSKTDEKPVQKILIEVNIAAESQKAGVLIVDCFKLVEVILTLPSLKLQGLMCLPPLVDIIGESRKYFAMLFELKQKIEYEFSLTLPHLSMGTSSDYKEAIYEGATLVRIGTDIFGPREY